MDWLEQRPDVNKSKIALIGLSFGGILAPLAASREHRFSAVMAIDGLSNMTVSGVQPISFRRKTLIHLQQLILPGFGKEITSLYESGDQPEFDTVINGIAANTSTSSQARWLIDQSLFSFNTHSPYEWLTRLSNITMTADTVRQIPMPVFVAKGQDDNSTLNQPDIAHQLLTTQRPNGKQLTTFHEFLTRLGAGEYVHE